MAARLKKPLAMLAALVALSLAVLYFALRPERIPDKQTGSAPSPGPAAVAPSPSEIPQRRTAAQIVETAVASTGRLSAVASTGDTRAVGLATVMGPESMITTCHELAGDEKLIVDIGGQSLEARIDAADREIGLCRLSVAGLAAPALAPAAEHPKPDDAVFALGLNSASQLALTEGSVRGFRPMAGGQALELSMPIAPAGTGGGVFDAQGRLVAIATTKYQPNGFGVALPASWASRLP